MPFFEAVTVTMGLRFVVAVGVLRLASLANGTQNTNFLSKH